MYKLKVTDWRSQGKEVCEIQSRRGGYGMSGIENVQKRWWLEEPLHKRPKIVCEISESLFFWRGQAALAGAHTQALSVLVDFISFFLCVVGGELGEGWAFCHDYPSRSICKKIGSLYEVYCHRFLKFGNLVSVRSVCATLIMLHWYLSEAVEAASPLSCTLAQFFSFFFNIFLCLWHTLLLQLMNWHIKPTWWAGLIYSLIDSGKAWEMGAGALTFNLLPFIRISLIICISVTFGGHELFCFVLDPVFGFWITL